MDEDVVEQIAKDLSNKPPYHASFRVQFYEDGGIICAGWVKITDISLEAIVETK